jgi:hypothetical protein
MADHGKPMHGEKQYADDLKGAQGALGDLFAAHAVLRRVLERTPGVFAAVKPADAAEKILELQETLTQVRSAILRDRKRADQ